MLPTSNKSQAGLDWRQALQRYAPRIVVCQHCNERLWSGVERVEGLCTFHLYACGLGIRKDSAQHRLLIQLTHRIAQLHPASLSDDIPS
jgi:hypothetical protein